METPTDAELLVSCPAARGLVSIERCEACPWHTRLVGCSMYRASVPESACKACLDANPNRPCVVASVARGAISADKLTDVAAACSYPSPVKVAAKPRTTPILDLVNPEPAKEPHA